MSAKGEDFIAGVLREEPTMPRAVVRALCHRLMVLASRAHRLAEDRCNYGLDDEQEREDEANDSEATELVSGFGEGFGLHIQGDPRGVVFKLIVPSGRGYDFGNEGQPVPVHGEGDRDGP